MDWIRALQPSGGAWSPAELAQRRASDAETIGSAVTAIGPGAVAWAVETAERITARFRDEGEQLGVPSSSTGFSRLGAEVGLLIALVSLAGDIPPEDIQIPPALTQLARVAVRQGMPVDALVHKAWASHTASQDELLGEIVRLVPAEEQVATIRAVSAAMFATGNVTINALSEAYGEERRSWDGRLPEERRRVIASLIRGGAVPPDAESILGVRLAGGHRFALAFAASGRHVPELAEAVEAFARDAAKPLGADRLLVLPHEGAIELWWTSAREPRPDAAAILRRVKPPEGVRIALGPAGLGLEGFRTSYLGAQDAARVARIALDAEAGQVWPYEEVAHLAMMLGDRAAAARFIREELGDLLDPTERLADIRTTLRRYLETGNSRIAVAGELHIAPSTVAYRVAQAEELLGPSIRERPLQLLLALQLVHLVPDLAG